MGDALAEGVGVVNALAHIPAEPHVSAFLVLVDSRSLGPHSSSPKRKCLQLQYSSAGAAETHHMLPARPL